MVETVLGKPSFIPPNKKITLTSHNKRTPDVRLPNHEDLIQMIIDKLQIEQLPVYKIVKWIEDQSIMKDSVAFHIFA